MTAPDKARSHRSLASFGVAALLAMTAATAQMANSPTGIDDSGSYQHEVQSCLSGNTQQDRDTCLREARNAQADKKRGLLDNNQAQFEANATARCHVLTGRQVHDSGPVAWPCHAGETRRHQRWNLRGGEFRLRAVRR